jgi:hypothetical protein
MLLGCGEPGSSRAGAVADAAAPVASSAAANGPEGVRAARLLESFAEVTLGAAPYQFRAVVQRNNLRVDTIAVPAMSVEDTSIARVEGGAVRAVEVGQTSVRIEVAPGQRLRGVVYVTERVFSDSVWLSRGQVRAWELKPSWYRITVDAKAPPGEPQLLELAADLICVPDRRGPSETIVCRVRQNTRILLRHTGVGSSQGPALAVVTILRTPR